MQSLASALVAGITQALSALAPADFAAVGLAFLLMRLARRAGMWVYAVVALPGTALHEFSHFVVALLLGARPTFPSLIPQRTEHSWRLGEVRFRPGRARAMFVALAPLLLAPLAVWWAVAYVAQAAWPWYAPHVWIVAALLQACLPSRTDWRLALPALALSALAMLVVAAAWYFLSR